ncbi:MAG TPA: hypothetical protein VFP44_23020 [Usitatibacter sp.]|nr:hypothetical protein [Usitatibacter sp.]
MPSLQRVIAAVAIPLATAVAHAASLPLQAELFQRQYPDARADGFRAAGRVSGLGVFEVGYTRTLFNAPDASRVRSLEWRPSGTASSGLALRAVERREGDARIRTFEVGWRLAF